MSVSNVVKDHRPALCAHGERPDRCRLCKLDKAGVEILKLRGCLFTVWRQLVNGPVTPEAWSTYQIVQHIEKALGIDAAGNLVSSAESR